MNDDVVVFFIAIRILAEVLSGLCLPTLFIAEPRLLPVSTCDLLVGIYFAAVLPLHPITVNLLAYLSYQIASLR